MSKFNRGGLPWAMGKDVSNCATAQDVMKVAGLDWSVQKCELVGKMPFRIGSNNELGEDALCEICTQHPRFHNEYGNIRQTGLGMACEEAARLIFETEEFGLCQIQGTNTEPTDDFDEAILEIQLWVLDLLKKKENPVEQRIEQIFDVVQMIQNHLNQTGEILDTWKNDHVKKNHVLSQMREETYIKNWISIYQ